MATKIETKNMGRRKALSDYFGGLPVRDAKRPLSIRITAEDIACSVPSDPRSCAMAQAAKRAIDAEEVLVFKGSTWLKVGDHIEYYTNPLPLRRDVIDRLDAGKTVVEGFYTLQPPSKSKALGASGQRRVKFEAKVKRGEVEHHPRAKKPGRKPKPHTERVMSVIHKPA